MSWTCQCPQEIEDTIPVCGSCAQARPARTRATPGRRPCDGCGDPVGWARLVPREQTQQHYCASCQLEWLKVRAARDPIRPGAMRDCQEQLARVAARCGGLDEPHPADSEPGIFERAGHPDHPFPQRRFPRPVAYFAGLRDER